MSFLAVLLLALSMSADAFAAALSKGARLDRPGWGEALRTGAIFGGIEAVTSTPEQLAAKMSSEMMRMGKVVRDAGIRIE